MTGYRILSAVQGVAYLALALSILLVPPATAPGHQSPVTTFAGTGLWTVFFLIGALFLLTTALLHPQSTYLGHTALFVIVISFGVANAGTSIVNHSGWIVASLCSALAAGHLIANRQRPRLSA